MIDPDVRWKQRFSNYQKALAQLTEAVELYTQRSLSNIERQGFVKAFEFTHELDDLLLPYKIDLSLYRQIENDDLIDHIQRVGIDFYRR